MLNNPFSGDFKILPTGFELNSKIMREVDARPDLQKDLRGMD
jgi:hypothetical protein